MASLTDMQHYWTQNARGVIHPLPPMSPCPDFRTCTLLQFVQCSLHPETRPQENVVQCVPNSVDIDQRVVRLVNWRLLVVND